MSIYSGFATRQLQQTYDHCINSLLFILQKRILKFYTNQKTDEYKFSSLVQKMFMQMKQMEKSKYLDPKCSYAIQQLFQYVIKQNCSQGNATIQENSIAQQSLQEQVIQKRPTQQVFQRFGKQRNYQIPIRTQKNSPSKVFISKSKSNEKNIGRIISSNNKSKQKIKSITIEHGRQSIAERIPSAVQGNRFHNKIYSSSPNSDLKARHISFDRINSKKGIQKVSSRAKDSRKHEEQVAQIIQDYIFRTRRVSTGHPNRRNNISNQQRSQEMIFKS